MACGAGLYAGAAIATLIVWIALKLIGLLESQANWKRFPMLYEVRGKDEQSMFADILAVLDREHLRLNVVDRDKLGDQQRVTFAILASSARHKDLLAKLTASDATDHVSTFRDEEED
jgi:putative Mg2+ transporter-C (MgtC) family protein